MDFFIPLYGFQKQIFKDKIVWGLVLGIKALITYQMGSVLFLYWEENL